MATKESIKVVVRSRLPNLSRDDRRMLSYAALLGHGFDVAFLALAAGCECEEVTARLERARDWVSAATGESTSGQFRFRHALVRDAFVEALPDATARRLHRDIVRALETLPDIDSRVEALAHHAFEAQLTEKVLTYGERAGDGALATRALAEATHFYQLALTAANGPTSRERLRAKLANVARLESV